ncbi:MAG: hypothetical protein HC890_04305 [Chloroflexaceae bacterium]|nr:hypothetical protein [Chloroflexaceae bacterium]
MKPIVNTLRVGLLGCLVGAALGCQSWFNFSWVWAGQAAIPIADLAALTNPAEPVQLAGTVGDRAPFLGSGAYQLQDETGSLWVVSSTKALPEPGERLVIEAQIKYAKITVENQDFSELYGVEVKRLERFPVESAPSAPKNPLQQP